MSRTCTARTGDGRPCRATPQGDRPFCRLHDPAQAEAVAAARRLGGAHRRRRRATDELEPFRGLRDVAAFQAFLELAARDVIAMESSPARVRLAVAVVTPATRLLERSDLAARIARLEVQLAQLADRSERAAPPDADPPERVDP